MRYKTMKVDTESGEMRKGKKEKKKKPRREKDKEMSEVVV
jgi:hypothetical protein